MLVASYKEGLQIKHFPVHKYVAYTSIGMPALCTNGAAAHAGRSGQREAAAATNLPTKRCLHRSAGARARRGAGEKKTHAVHRAQRYPHLTEHTI
jgi:hypothetical protein